MSAIQKLNPHWDNEFILSVYGDPYVTGKWGFTICVGVGGVGDFKFDSGLVYETEADARQAVNDAAHVAWSYQGYCRA